VNWRASPASAHPKPVWEIGDWLTKDSRIDWRLAFIV